MRDEGWVGQVMRWGQVNLKEDDPLTLDVDFWVDYWRRTKIQGVTLNAGVGVAYYPTQIPFIGGRSFWENGMSSGSWWRRRRSWVCGCWRALIPTGVTRNFTKPIPIGF
jgi:hypothetical protein